MTLEETGPSRRRGWRTWTFFALTLAVAGFGVFVLRKAATAPPSPSPRFTIETRSTRALGFTPDGTRFVSKGDRTIEQWDLATRMPVARWLIKSYDAYSMVWAPDGSAVAVMAPDLGSNGSEFSVRDARTGAPRFSWTIPFYEVSSLSFTADSSAVRWVKKSVKDLTYTVEDRSAADGTVIRSKTFPGSRTPIFVTSGEGRFIVDLNSPRAGAMKVIDADDGHEVFALPDRPGTVVIATALAPAASALAVARDDGTIETVEIPSGRLRSRHQSRRDLYRVQGLGFSPDRTRLAVSSNYAPSRGRGFRFNFQGGVQAHCYLLDTSTGQVAAQLGHGSPFFSPDGRTVAVTESNGNPTRFYDLPQPPAPRRLAPAYP